MKRALRAALLVLCALAAILTVRLALPALRERIAESAALEQLGKPYAFGEAGPDSFDCSGLMTFAYARAGVELAHYTRAVAGDERCETVADPERLRRGDLVFFDTVSDSGIDHVGLWLGGGRFVHASSAEGEVIVSRFDERWRGRFKLAKRVLR